MLNLTLYLLRDLNKPPFRVWHPMICFCDVQFSHKALSDGFNYIIKGEFQPRALVESNANSINKTFPLVLLFHYCDPN